MYQKRKKASLEFACESHSFALKSVSIPCDFIRAGLEAPIIIIISSRPAAGFSASQPPEATPVWGGH